MVRAMQPGDAKEIAKLCISALGHEADEDRIRGRIEQLTLDPVYFLAVFEDETDGRVKGFIQAESYDLVYDADGWNIMALAVEQTARRQGIGRRLVRALEEKAKARGDSFIRLNSRVERTDAHAFYESLGYACDKLQKRLIRRLDED